MTALLLVLCLQETAERVAQLAPELETRDVARIYRAIERLAELGAPAAPILEARARNAGEVARPYFVLAAEEARRSASLPDGGRLRRFTITYASQDLGLLMQDFQRRTGARFSLDGFGAEELPQVAAELKEAAFGEALLTIARAAKMTPRRDSGTYFLQPAPVELPMFSYAGFLFYLESFTQQKTVTFASPARNRISLDFQVIWDPAIPLVSASPAVVTAAADDQGRPLTQATEKKPADGSPEPEYLQEGISLIELSGPAGLATIDFVRGYVPILIEKTSLPLALAAPAPGSSVKAGGFELVLKRWRMEEGAFDLEVTRAGQKPEAWKGLPLRVTVSDPSGGRVASSVGVERGPEATTLTVYCDLLGRGLRSEAPRFSKVEVSIATECIERRVPFEFRNLKLR